MKRYFIELYGFTKFIIVVPSIAIREGVNKSFQVTEDYFKNQAQTDNVEEALRNLGEDDYTEPEIRLIRIKFLSELGN